MTGKEMLVGLSTSAARRIATAGKVADGSKASNTVISKLKEVYGK